MPRAQPGPRISAPASRLAIATVAGALALGLAACGGSGSSSGSSTSAATTAPSTTSSPGASTTSSPGASTATTLSAAPKPTSTTSTTTTGSLAPKTSPATLIEVDGICSAYHTQLGKITPPTFAPTQATKKQLPLAAAYIAKTLPIMHQTEAALRAAAKHSTTVAPFDVVAARFARVVAAEQAAEQAARRGDLQAWNAAIGATQNVGASLEEQTTKLRLVSC